ncbi:hypothetical protein LTR95_007413 [Oleoguttula sp. CCFEE 5521]
METSANDFYDSLNTIGLVQYQDKFVREAFDTWEVLIDITESDLRKNSYDESSYDMVEGQNGLGKADPVLAVDEDANGNGVAFVSVNGKHRYKRHPKADEYAPDRPPSAYVCSRTVRISSSCSEALADSFAETRAELKGSNPSFTEIAKAVGERWRVLAEDEKATYESRSQAAKDKYYSQLSEYKKTSKFAEYQIYLADFKAKHEPPPHGGKRKRDDKLSCLTSRCSNGTDAGASSPKNSYLDAESSLDPRSSFVEFPSSSNTPDFKHPKYTPSQSTTRQCNAAAADSSSFSPRLPKPRFAPKPTPERQKPATLPLLPPYKETVCVSEYAFTTHINHPMAISTQLAYGYIPNLGNNLPSTSRSSSSLNNNSAIPPDASLEKVPAPSTRVRTPDFLTSIEGPANEGRRMADRRLPPLLMGRGNRYVGQGQASPLGAVGIASLLRAGEHLEASGSPGGSTREGDRRQ